MVVVVVMVVVGRVGVEKKKSLRKQSRKRDARDVDAAAFEDVMSGRGEKNGEDKSGVTH